MVTIIDDVLINIIYDNRVHQALHTDVILLCLVYTLVETTRNETIIRVWRVHSSHLTRSQPVLISSRGSRKNVGKLYLSQRTRISRLIIESTLIYTLVQFSNIIYLVPGKIVNFFNSFEGRTFAAGIYTTHINRKMFHFFSPFTEYFFMAGKFFIYLVTS